MSKLSVILGSLALSISCAGCGKPAGPQRAPRNTVPAANYGTQAPSGVQSTGSSGIQARPNILRPTLADGYERAMKLDDAARRQVQRSIDANNRRRARRAKLKVYPRVTPRERAKFR